MQKYAGHVKSGVTDVTVEPGKILCTLAIVIEPLIPANASIHAFTVTQMHFCSRTSVSIQKRSTGHYYVLKEKNMYL